ncbi:MAG: hypothetical protein OZSIB_4047 [Candidatus Ozemobacter sibiricus]|uniref:Uncharacterized protein n=1 Tax=Candidatus Ozemobacter sibiricus TaxID=2268124 RepID=A0A367ZAX4_9BACT|nr:MAG: hypothetical protein OZSIB_4047 [Candidatus Ozemobacter sibiricus]
MSHFSKPFLPSSRFSQEMSRSLRRPAKARDALLERIAPAASCKTRSGGSVCPQKTGGRGGSPAADRSTARPRRRWSDRGSGSDDREEDGGPARRCRGGDL